MTRILPDGDLLITAPNWFRSDLASGLREHGYMHGEGLVAEFLRDQFEFIQPEAIGALTEAPILTDDADYSDEVMSRYHGPEPHEGAKVWWFPDYCVRDPWEELARKGRVRFTLAR